MSGFSRQGERGASIASKSPIRAGLTPAPAHDDKREWLKTFMQAVQHDLRSNIEVTEDEPHGYVPTASELERFFESKGDDALVPNTPCASLQRPGPHEQFMSLLRDTRSSDAEPKASESAASGRYVFEHEIGRGSSGTVYEARDRDTGTRLALKVLSETGAHVGRGLKEEFRQLSEISHRNLVTLYELGFDGEHWVLAMEFVNGQRFDEYVRGNALRLRLALQQLVSGIAALHRAGKLHRDIKPHNVLVTDDGRVVILDLGLHCSPAPSPNAAAQETSVLMHGTPAYMAPEGLLGEPPSPAGDWYSVGMMLYEALTGRLPFKGPWHETRAVLPEDVPHDLAHLCRRLLERDPARRIGDAALLRHFDVQVHDADPHAQAASSEPRQFVGRTAQLRHLRTAFHRVRNGMAMTIFVSGSAGSGKSALVSRFVDELESTERSVVLRGRCYERENIPYKILDSIVDALDSHATRSVASGASSIPSSALLSLTQLLSRLQRSRVGGANVTGKTDRLAVLSAFTNVLKAIWKRMSAHRPLIVLIEDLQWGDAASAKLLRRLLATPDAPRLLLICTYRREDIQQSSCLRCVTRYIDSYATDPHVRQIEVEPMNPAEVDQLSRHLLGEGAAADASLSRRLSSESRGMPFLLADLAAFQRLGPSDARAPSTIRAMLASRISKLSKEARSVLDVLSVASGPLHQRVALEIAGRSPAERTSIQELRAARLIRTCGTRSSDLAEPYHAVIRETVIRSLLETRRRRLRKQILRGNNKR